MLPALVLAAALKSAPVNPITVVKKELAQQGLTKKEIAAFFSDKRLRIYTQKSIAAKPVNWAKYQAEILQPDSLAAGVQFITDHQASFDAAEKSYGVPKEMIAAILRMETDFGQYVGTYVVPNVFYSFLRHGKKVAWAEENLVNLLVYAKREKVDPFTLKGSYAGAMGYPQFLPTSILTFGVDGDADGKVNLYRAADAVPSLANFLAQHGFGDDEKAALAHYYGTSVGYPDAAVAYAQALKALLPAPPPSSSK